jgi:hypothetical protein
MVTNTQIDIVNNSDSLNVNISLPTIQMTLEPEGMVEGTVRPFLTAPVLVLTAPVLILTAPVSAFWVKREESSLHLIMRD